MRTAPDTPLELDTLLKLATSVGIPEDEIAHALRVGEL